MKYFLVILIGISLNCEAQQRLSIDGSYKKNMLNATLGFHKVVKNNWLLSGGITLGGKGQSSKHYLDYSPNYGRLRSSYSMVDEMIINDNSTYELKRYDVQTNVLTVQFGIGYFHSFDVKHGLRGHLNIIYGQAFNKISAYYNNQNTLYVQKHTPQHQVSAVNFEIYHTIQMWKKFTFFYGAKIPYYFRLDQNNYNPIDTRENMFGLEPELSLGLTFLIGKC